jgi:hypothetical protein
MGLVMPTRRQRPSDFSQAARLVENHAPAVALHATYYNFVRIH